MLISNSAISFNLGILKGNYSFGCTYEFLWSFLPLSEVYLKIGNILIKQHCSRRIGGLWNIFICLWGKFFFDWQYFKRMAYLAFSPTMSLHNLLSNFPGYSFIEYTSNKKRTHTFSLSFHFKYDSSWFLFPLPLECFTFFWFFWTTALYCAIAVCSSQK